MFLLPTSPRGTSYNTEVTAVRYLQHLRDINSRAHSGACAVAESIDNVHARHGRSRRYRRTQVDAAEAPLVAHSTG
jgi:hypothetical protein